MRRLTSACAFVSSLALVAACTEEAAAPPEAVPPSPAPTAPAAPPVSYACESGQSIAVAYPDTSTARLSYRGQTHVLRIARSASGARYVGAGVEWWTANRDGRESATLSRLGPGDEIGTVVLERCSRPAVGAPLAPAPGPDDVSAGIAPCRGLQLRLSDEGGDAGAGNRVRDIGVQNIGASPCSLTGYPGVVLQDGQGRDLTSIRAEQALGSYFKEGRPPAPVVLAPRAKAAFELAWSVIPHEGEGERDCPSATGIRVTPPGDASPVSLDLELKPCGGRVKISPLRSLSGEGVPAPEPSA